MIPFSKRAFKFLPSTNAYLKKHYKKIADFTVVRAEEQGNGYGRKGRAWHSPKGGLWFSFIVSTNDPFFWIMCSSVSIVDVFPELKIKWPNDVYHKKRKIAGILSERIEDRIIVGIGINVNNKIPSDLEDKAESLSAIYNKEFNVQKVLDKILKKISENVSEPENIILKWKNYSVILGKRITIKKGEMLVEGIVEDLAEDGSIIVSNPNHREKITYGDIINWEEI